jgi:hypothetical protein
LIELEIQDIMDPIKFVVMDSNTFSDEMIAHTVDLKVFNIVGP